MLDNLNGSSDEVGSAVAALQAARGGEEKESEPSGQTDDAVEETQELSEGHEEESEVVEQEESNEEYESEEPELYTVKVGGQEREVNFDQLLENYSKGEDYTNKTMGLADERKAWETEKSKQAETFAAEQQKLAATIANLGKHIVETDKTPEEWAELRDLDPSEYLRQKEVREDKLKSLQLAQAEGSQKLEAQRTQTLNDESVKLMTVMGDAWKDPDIRDKEISKMYAYVESRGITKEETPNILDHRFWAIAADAMKYQELQQTGNVVKKQIKKAPKTVKSGRPGPKRVQKDVDDARKALKGSGKNVDAVALMRAQRKNR